MAKPEEKSERKGTDGPRAFAVQLERILKQLFPVVSLGAAVSLLSELLSVLGTLDRLPSIAVFFGRSWPILAGLAGVVVGAAAVAAFVQSRGRRQGKTILLEREVRQTFDEALLTSIIPG